MRLAIALTAGLVALTGTRATAATETVLCDGLGESTSACVLQVDGPQTIAARWHGDSHRIRLELSGTVANVGVSVDSGSPANGTLIVGLGSERDSFAIGRTIVNPGGAGSLVRCGVPARTTWVTIFGLRSVPADYRLTVTPHAQACSPVADAAPHLAANEPAAGPTSRPERRDAAEAAPDAGSDVAAAPPQPAPRPPSAVLGDAAEPGEETVDGDGVTAAAGPVDVRRSGPADRSSARPEDADAPGAPPTAASEPDATQPPPATAGETLAAALPEATEAAPAEREGGTLVSVRVVNFSPRQRTIELRDAVCDRELGIETFYPWDLRAVDVCLDDRGLASIEAREQDGDWRPFADLRDDDLVRF